MSKLPAKQFLSIRTIASAVLLLWSNAIMSQDLVALIKRVKSSVVVINTFDVDGNPIAQGSGFFINDKGDVITNSHVIEAADTIEILTSSSETYKVADILARDFEDDLAMLAVKIPAEMARPLSVSSVVPEVGEKILVIGSPKGLEQTATEGIVAAVRTIQSLGKVIQITAPISPGSSGSPVMNMAGQVIGVATFQLIEGQNLNFAMPVELISRLYEIEKATRQVRTEQKTYMSEAISTFSEGQKRTWAGDYKSALPYFQAAVKKDPKYFLAYKYIGHCYFDIKNFSKAIEAYKKAAEVNSSDANTFHLICACNFILGNDQEAIIACLKSLSLEEDIATYNNLGLTYIRINEIDKAISVCKKSLALDPISNGIAYQCLGIGYLHTGRDNQAVGLLVKAVDIDPNNEYSVMALGLAYMKIGNKDLAIKQYERLKLLDKAKAQQLFDLLFPN